MTILQMPPLAPTPTPIPPVPGDNQAVIVGILDPSLIPAAPQEDGGCTPQLCESWTGTTADLANPPGSGWEYTKVIAEIEANKGTAPAVNLDDILGYSQPSAIPSVIAGLVISLVIVAAALAALVRHRRAGVTSPSVTTAEEV